MKRLSQYPLAFVAGAILAVPVTAFTLVVSFLVAGFIAIVGPVAAGLFLVSGLVFGQARINRRAEKETEK